MAISAKEVNELRKMTGAGMMDCKKALTEADGDMEKAIELLRKLKALEYARKNPGFACPAKWKPGEKTLKPGIDLVGKI